MRPLRLSMTAFGPFPGRVELDFQRVTDHPIFGIYGPTGSGKTTVLDALAFALFGESSGAERQADQLRSHFAGPETLTSVELLFETGGSRYFVRRSPKQETAKQRGEGTTERPGEAFLFDATGVDPGVVSFPERCGTPLVEKKVTDVNERLGEIVGFQAAQFRQVVLLPQGKFRELLTATSNERSAILKRIFETGIYEAFTQKLKSRSGELAEKKGLLEERLQWILSSVGVDSPEALSTRQKELTDEITTFQEKKGEAEGNRDAARERLQEEQAKSRRFEELREAEAVLAGLEARASEMETLAEKLRSAEFAAEVEPVYERLLEARDRLERETRQREERQTALGAATERKENAASKLEELAAKEGEREELKASLAEYDRLQEEVARLEEERRSFEQSRKERMRIEEELDALEKQYEEASREVEGISERLDTLAVDRERLNAHLRELQELQSRGKAIAGRSEAAGRAREQQERLEKLDQERKSLSEELAAAEEQLTAGERKRWERYRHTLAESLEAGAPCPVCGSTEHPAPAHLAAPDEEAPTEEELGTLREGARALRERLGEAQTGFATLEAELKSTKDRIAEWEEELGGPPEEGEAHRIRERVEALLRGKEELEERLQEEQGLRERREELRKVAGDQAKQRQELEPRLQSVRGREERARGILEDREERIPEELRDLEVLRDRRRLAAERLEREKAALTAAEKESREAESSWTTEKARLEESDRLLREAESLAEERRNAFRERLQEVGFDSEEGFATARLAAEERKALRERLEEYGNRKSAAAERRNRAKEAVAEESEPDLEVAAREVQEAEEAVNELLTLITTRRESLRQLEERGKEYREVEREYREVERQHRLTAQLFGLADGHNEIRTRLVDYVLSVYFDEVLAQANERLFSMSNHRYTLHRKAVTGSGRGRAGLDIEVYDAFTDRRRDGTTLSGGEGFLASLALALGLSDTVQAELGGLRLEVIFIDEGFGHLDEEALEEALNTLDSLTGSGRSVGIISHVEEVKRRVPAGFEVRGSMSGSSVEIRRGGVG